MCDMEAATAIPIGPINPLFKFLSEGLKTAHKQPMISRLHIAPVKLSINAGDKKLPINKLEIKTLNRLT